MKGLHDIKSQARYTLRVMRCKGGVATHKSEVSTFAVQRLLGTKSFVKKLITTEPTTAEKLIGKIRELAAGLKNKKSPDAKAQAELLKKAESLFMKALSEAGGTIDADGKIHLANREDEEMEESTAESRVKRLKSVDNGAGEQYNDSEYMTRRGWADGVLSEEDRRLLREKISETKARGFKAHVQLSDGSYLFEINNKIVLVSGDFESPFYDGVVDINTDNASTAYTIRKDIENAVNGKRCTRASFLEIVADMYGEEILMVYNRGDWIGSSSDPQRPYPTRPDGYKDFGYSREQRYGSGSSQEVGRTVITDSRLAPPSHFPVRRKYLDVTGNTRYVVEYVKGEYSIYGTGSPRPHNVHPTIEEAIAAENNSLLRAYARETDHTVTWVKTQLQDNPDFLKAWGKKRLLQKMPGGKVSRSRSTTGDVVTISKGELAKLHANYAGDKVFNKGAVVEAVKGIDALKRLPAATRNELVTRLWRGYNERLHQQGFEQFTEIMWHQIHAEILQESGFDLTEDEIHVMDEQIVDALHAIVASGKPSIKADADVERLRVYTKKDAAEI